MLGLLMAGAVAGYFAFTYEKVNFNNVFDRYLGHLTTFFLIFGIGLLMEITGWILAYLGGVGTWKDPIAVAGISVYIAIILFDFWNLLRSTFSNIPS